MIIKQRVKLTRVNDEGKKQNLTLTIAGRTVEELNGRVEKHINRYLQHGWSLR